MFKCEHISIRYHFFGNNRPSECGHPQLKLQCDQESKITTIEMVGVKYKVLEITPYRRILKLTRVDTLDNGLCQFHSPLRVSIVNFELFDLHINYINTTFAFDCLQLAIPSPQIIGQYPCGSRIHNNISITTNTTFLHGCVANVTFPVAETNLLQFRNGSLSLASILRIIMEEGFQVKWEENTEACRKCNASGGACGFDNYVGHYAIAHNINPTTNVVTEVCTK
ncbi:hypothetical protein V6N11_001777 [Hibiscus sabdariffa]|uniref:non-specific serine/threonine protein kinase n=1 Tax=Hibiscus sabdariffa TaxID=183260 RepID=A0ABR2QTH0_9ROSI